MPREDLTQAAVTQCIKSYDETHRDLLGICGLGSSTFQPLRCITEPLLTEVDVVICDIPFGRQYGTIEGCRDSLYKADFSDIP